MAQILRFWPFAATTKLYSKNAPSIVAAKSIRLPRYVVQQHNRFWARFGVPEDVRPAFGGSREHWVRPVDAHHEG